METLLIYFYIVVACMFYLALTRKKQDSDVMLALLFSLLWPVVFPAAILAVVLFPSKD